MLKLSGESKFPDYWIMVGEAAQAALSQAGEAPEQAGEALALPLSRPSEGGRVVRLLGQPLGDRMGEFKIVQMVPLLRAQ